MDICSINSNSLIFVLDAVLHDIHNVKSTRAATVFAQSKYKTGQPRSDRKFNSVKINSVKIISARVKLAEFLMSVRIKFTGLRLHVLIMFYILVKI
jgi:hypothetical protein